MIKTNKQLFVFIDKEFISHDVMNQLLNLL